MYFKVQMIISMVFALVVVPFSATAKHHKPISPIAGTRAALIAQNVAANHAHLARIKDTPQLKKLEKGKVLVPISHIKGVIMDSRTKPENRFLRVEAAQFLGRFAGIHLVKYHRRVFVTSAVRTMDYQRQLRKRNPNAAKADSGLLQSSHPTGETFDISTRVMVPKEAAWARMYLYSQKRAGRIIVEEETIEPCFHIMVIPASLLKATHAKRREHRT